MTKDQAITFLERDGDFLVPCSRYGRHTSDCAPVAYAVAVILAAETGEPMTEESLDYAMGLAVNDHDDVQYLLSEYGTEYGFKAEDYIDA